MAKWTKSIDGEIRRDIWVQVRLTIEEMTKIWVYSQATEIFSESTNTEATIEDHAMSIFKSSKKTTIVNDIKNYIYSSGVESVLTCDEHPELNAAIEQLVPYFRDTLQ